MLIAVRVLAKVAPFRAGLSRLPTVLIGSQSRRDAVRSIIARDWYVGHAILAELDIAKGLPALEAGLSPTSAHGPGPCHYRL